MTESVPRGKVPQSILAQTTCSGLTCGYLSGGINNFSHITKKCKGWGSFYSGLAGLLEMVGTSSSVSFQYRGLQVV